MRKQTGTPSSILGACDPSQIYVMLRVCFAESQSPGLRYSELRSGREDGTDGQAAREAVIRLVRVNCTAVRDYRDLLRQRR